MKQEKSLESPQEQKWGIRHVVYGLLLGQVSTILAIVAIGLIDQDIDLEDPSLEITAILQSALWIGTLGIPLWLYYSKGVSWRQFGWRFKRSDIFKGLLIGLGTQIAAGLLYLPLYVIFDDIDVSEPAKELVDKATGLGVFLLFLVVVVGAPVVEAVSYTHLTLPTKA